jgi:hypothetical protein
VGKFKKEFGFKPIEVKVDGRMMVLGSGWLAISQVMRSCEEILGCIQLE